MTDALNIIYYIFNKFITLLFDDFTMFNNVSIGWVMVVVVILSIMFSNILSIAKSSVSTAINKEEINSYGQVQITNRITGVSRLKDGQ